MRVHFLAQGHNAVPTTRPLRPSRTKRNSPGFIFRFTVISFCYLLHYTQSSYLRGPLGGGGGIIGLLGGNIGILIIGGSGGGGPYPAMGG